MGYTANMSCHDLVMTCQPWWVPPRFSSYWTQSTFTTVLLEGPEEIMGLLCAHLLKICCMFAPGEVWGRHLLSWWVPACFSSFWAHFKSIIVSFEGTGETAGLDINFSRICRILPWGRFETWISYLGEFFLISHHLGSFWIYYSVVWRFQRDNRVRPLVSKDFSIFLPRQIFDNIQWFTIN